MHNWQTYRTISRSSSTVGSTIPSIIPGLTSQEAKDQILHTLQVHHIIAANDKNLHACHDRLIRLGVANPLLVRNICKNIANFRRRPGVCVR